jgi:mono/diheme cytochrome c family protein
MKSVVRWAVILVVVAACLAAVRVGLLYSRSWRELNRRYDIPPTEVAIPTDAAELARGQHLAQVRGCMECHGDRLQGQVFEEQPRVIRLVAPNIARLARSYSVVDLERSIRHGVNPRGTTLRGMPSRAFYQLSDRDLGAIIAWLRSVPPATDSLPPTEIRWLGRIDAWRWNVAFAVDSIDQHAVRPPPPAPDDTIGQGRYLAFTVCVACHGQALGGVVDTWSPSPDLKIVSTYTEPEFHHLLRTGEARVPHPMRRMTSVAQVRLKNLTDLEIHQLYTYLHTLAEPGARRSP